METEFKPSAVIKVVQVGKRWRWQLLAPNGAVVAYGTQEHDHPNKVLDDISSVGSYFAGGPLPLGPMPAVGQVLEQTNSLRLWRRS